MWAARSPAAPEPQKRSFLRPSTMTRNSRSAALFSTRDAKHHITQASVTITVRIKDA